MESGLLAADLLSSDVQALLNDDFLALKCETDLDELCELSNDDISIDNDDKMVVSHHESWDPDVLLSNSCLPEINPLLELDGVLGDDYQKMLNEWESQMGSLQQSQDSSFVVDDGMSSFGVSRTQDSLFDDFIRPPVTSSASFTTTTPSGSQQTNVTASLSMPIFTPKVKVEPDPVFSYQDAPTPHDSLTVTTCTNNSLTSERSGRLTLGKRSLAGIVISSGPGGHFETYEGTQKSTAVRTAVLQENTYTMCDVKPNTSLLRVNRSASTIKPPCPVSDVSSISHTSQSVSQTCTDPLLSPVIEADINWQQLHTITTDLTQLTYEDVSTLEPLSPLPVEHTSFLDGPEPTSLAPFSSMHELSKSLLRCRQTVEQCSSNRDTTVERCDMESEEDNLGGQVLEASDVDHLYDQFEASAEFGGDDDDEDDFDDREEKASTILAAVQNHFASSTDASGNKERKSPRIVPSQRIKDALPREIVERIKASSQRSRTIAIIEPVNRHRDAKESPPRGKNPNSILASKKEDPIAPVRSVKTEQSLLSSSHSTILATRFQEAASSLNRSKQMRQMGIISPAPNSHQAQVSLDHDYCSSGNKANKRQRWNNPTPQMSKDLQHRQQSQTPHVNKDQRWNNHTAPMSKDLQQQRQKWSMVPNGDQMKPTTYSTSLLNVNKAVSSSIVIATSATTRPVVRVVTSGHTVNRYHPGVSPSPIRVTGPTPTPLTLHTGSSTTVLSASVSLRSPPTSQQRAQHRGSENDPKKDSGLESGEVSDASEGLHPAGEEDTLFSKVPSYLTAVNVQNSDSRTVTEPDETGAYDRLPAYVKGVASIGAAAAAVASRIPSSVVTLGDAEVKSPSPFCPSRSPSRFASRSPTRSRFPSRGSTPVRHSSRLRDSKSPGRRIRRRRSSSSSSKSSEPRKSSSSSRRRSLKKRSSRRRSRSRSPTCSPSPPRRSHFRSRSPLKAGFSLEKQRQEQQQRQRREEKNRQVEERRVVYVGKIAEGTTRADLRQRFEVFGPILEISLHFRDRGDNYGFVTFKYKNDAYEAIEHGNDNPSFSRVDLCFGGRRTFCKEKYSDLDYNPPSAYDDGFGSGGLNDFDALLQKARAGLTKK